METVTLLIHNIGQLCTMPVHAHQTQRGARFGDLGMIEHGALVIRDGVIVAVGDEASIKANYQGETVIDARGKCVTPGLVDCHTHTLWAGNRAAEFEQRIMGATYQEITLAGGGINYTTRHVRAASIDQLVEETMPRLIRMMENGATTIEVKSGYGLDTESEIKSLEAIVRLNELLPIDLVPTFLGAHAIPPEYQGRADDFTAMIVQEMIPAVMEWKTKRWDDKLFCDVFCETIAFSVEQSRRILEAGKTAGMALKIHSDEFEPLGGTRLAIELGATTADHLVRTSPEEIVLFGESNTIAVSMPPTPFGLGHHHYTPAKAILEAGGAVAIATDCNPGGAWCESMPFVMALATRYLRLSPAQALAGATVNAGFGVGRGEKIGTLATGALGDVVIWDVEDYRELSYRYGSPMTNTVIKRGEVIYPRLR